MNHAVVEERFNWGICITFVHSDLDASKLCAIQYNQCVVNKRINSIFHIVSTHILLPNMHNATNIYSNHPFQPSPILTSLKNKVSMYSFFICFILVCLLSLIILFIFLLLLLISSYIQIGKDIPLGIYFKHFNHWHQPLIKEKVGMSVSLPFLAPAPSEILPLPIRILAVVSSAAAPLQRVSKKP